MDKALTVAEPALPSVVNHEEAASSYSESELEGLLRRLVESSGGKASLLILWGGSLERRHMRSFTWALPEPVRGKLLDCVHKYIEESLPSRWSKVGRGPLANLRALQRELQSKSLKAGLGRLYALTMPVLIDGELVGLFVLLHSHDLPTFLRRYPQMYNLVLDRIESTVRQAGLLYNLMRERNWFETLLNRSNDGVAIVDREGKIVGLNPALESMSGWTVAEAVGRPLYQVAPISALGGRQEGVAPPSKGGYGLALYNQPGSINLTISADPVEAVLTDRQGQKLDVEVTGLTVRDSSGLPSGWVLTVRDISRRKETERLGKIFLSAMSHELQTPIAVIRGFAGLLSDPEIELEPGVIREKAQVILEESERLQKMVREILEAASIQAGGICLQREEVDIGRLVEKTARRLEPLAEAKGLKIRTKIELQVPNVWADAGRLEQVLSNLVENAIKYSPLGEVTVEARSHAQQVIVAVIDEGPGVSAEEAQRLFGLFQRGPEQQKVRGSGLGLFIAKSIVEAHGGSIGVIRGPQGGACFYFTIPQKET